MYKICLAVTVLLFPVTLFAASPLWTFVPTTPTAINIARTELKTVEYRVTNQSRKGYRLAWDGQIQGIKQLTGPAEECSASTFPGFRESCLLTLEIDGSKIASSIQGGPSVCSVTNNRPNPNQCYQPASANVPRITVTDK